MKVKIPNIRMSFNDLFTPVSVNDGAPRYSATFLIPKSNGDLVKTINNGIIEVAKAGFDKDWQAVLNKSRGSGNFPMLDGDLQTYAGYGGNWYIRANRRASEGPPKLYNRNKTQLTDNGTIYSGCYVNALLEFWAQNNKWGRVVRTSLLGVQFYAEGERFGGGSQATDDDFDFLEDAGMDILDMSF